MHPIITDHHAEAGVGKSQGVQGDDTGNSAAGADTWKMAARLGEPVEKIAKQRAEKEHNEKALPPDEILHVIAENQEEIEIANEMHDPAVDEKGSQPGDSSITPGIGRNKGQSDERFAPERKNDATDGQDEERDRPGDNGTPSQEIRIVLDGHPEKASHHFPWFVREFTGGGGFALGSFADTLHFPEGQGFTGFLRKFLFGRWRGEMRESVQFAGIKPKELAAQADVEQDGFGTGSRIGSKLNRNHRFVARQALQICRMASRLRGLPEASDRGGVGAPAQERKAHGVSVAGGALPVVGTGALNMIQARVTTRTIEHAIR